MTPQAIINVLDKHGERIQDKYGTAVWGDDWYGQFNHDNQPVFVAYQIRPGVWVERETKFARPYGAPA